MPAAEPKVGFFVSFRVTCPGDPIGLQGLGFRVQGLGFRVQGLGFRV